MSTVLGYVCEGVYYSVKGIQAAAALYSAHKAAKKPNKTKMDYALIVSNVVYATAQGTDMSLTATHTYENLGNGSSHQSPSCQKIVAIAAVKGTIVVTDTIRVAADPEKDKTDLACTILSQGTNISDAIQQTVPNLNGTSQEVLQEVKIGAPLAAQVIRSARTIRKEKRRQALEQFKADPLGCKRIIFKHDEVLNQYTCPLTKKPIRFIVKLDVPGVSMPEGLWYERKAMHDWVAKFPGRMPPGCPPLSSTLRVENIIEDSVSQRRIDERLQEIAKTI